MKKFISRLLLFLLILTTIVIPNVHATTIDGFLTNNKLVIHAVPPTDDMSAMSTFEDVGIPGLSVRADTCNETYTHCTVWYHGGPPYGEEQEVDIEYQYDETTKTIVDSLVADLPDEEYTMEDEEFIQYALFGTDETVFNYSNTIKQRLGYKNFYFVIGAGSDPGFASTYMADLKFNYEGTIYYIKPMNILHLKRVIYVPTDTQDSEILNVVRARFNAVGTGATITDLGSINAYLTSKYEDDYELGVSQGNPYVTSKTKKQYVADRLASLATDQDLSFVADATSNCYKVEVNGIEQEFVVIKDSTKIQNITYKTNDVNSNIEISTDSKKVPFDALIRVAKLNSGATYEHIMEVLNAENSETYDISLFANSTNSNITTLDDGTFKVRIPVPTSLVGKNLIVYYVNNNDEVEEHTVTPVSEGGKNYAEFTTTHFSVYTLAEGTATTQATAPATGDNIAVYLVLFLACLSAIIGVTVYTKKKNNK